MGFSLGSLGSTIDKISDKIGFANTTTGVAKLVEDYTGLKPSEQYAAGAVTGAANKLLGSDVVDGATGSSNSWLSSLFNGVSSLIGTGLGTLTDVLKDKYNLANQKELAKYTAEQQQKLNDRAYQQNLEMWNLANQYNSPAEQMKRFEEAGLNKNLIYGQQNTAVSAPQAQAATYDPGHFNPTDTRVQRAQLQLALAEHHLQVQNQAIENDMKRQQLRLSARAADREDKLVNAQIKNLENNTGLRYSELGLHSDEYRRKLYQSDLNEWNSRVLDYRARNKYLSIHDAQLKAGRRPMLSDYY